MLLLAFVLMLVAFRSIVVAIKAIVLNLLSVAAAYGVLVLVFQHGIGKGLLGSSSTTGIDPVTSLLLFVILFGLSMDYHVFIISRIRETFDRGASMDDAIAYGVKSTAGVVTSAAVVMVGVFSIFATLSILIFKQFGVGLAAAILIDATLVRDVLLPATMTLLDERKGYLRAGSSWLPRFEPEEPTTVVEATPLPYPPSSCTVPLCGLTRGDPSKPSALRRSRRRASGTSLPGRCSMKPEAFAQAETPGLLRRWRCFGQVEGRSSVVRMRLRQQKGHLLAFREALCRTRTVDPLSMKEGPCVKGRLSCSGPVRAGAAVVGVEQRSSLYRLLGEDQAMGGSLG